MPNFISEDQIELRDGIPVEFDDGKGWSKRLAMFHE